MIIKNLLKIPFNIFNKYVKLLKVLFKQTPFVFPKNSLFLGEPPLVILDYDDFVIVSIVIDDNGDDYNFNITSISLTFNHYDKHRDFGENLLLDNSESTIHQLNFSDFWVLHKKRNDNIIDLITKNLERNFSNILYNEEYSQYVFFIPFEDFAQIDLMFATNSFHVLSAIKEFLSKVNGKKVVREDIKITTVYFYIKEDSVA